MSRAPLDVFGLSFMDVICCGLGAVLALLVILSSQLATSEPIEPVDEPRSRLVADSFFALSASCETPAGSDFAIQSMTVGHSVRTALESLADVTPKRSRFSAFRSEPVDAGFRPFRVRLLGGRAAALVENFRTAVRAYEANPPSPYDTTVAAHLRSFVDQLEGSRTEGDWTAQIDEARKALAGCDHPRRKLPVERALEALATGWSDFRQVADVPTRCDFEFVTSSGVRHQSLIAKGDREVCVLGERGVYRLSTDCRE